MNIHDYIIVGSGPSAVIATQTLLDAGKKVTMVDVGERDTTFHKMIPEQDFLTLRTTDPDQYKYLIGHKTEGIEWTDIGKGAQITPPRRHMLKGVDTYLKIKSKSFSPVQSLGYGGLGIGWGLQCWEYSPADMESAGLDEVKMREAYDVVASRIGVSGSKDEASRYTLGTLKTFQKPARMDRNHRYIYEKYNQKRNKFNAKGVYISRTPLALITQDVNGRKGYRYRDMDFYSDKDKSAWRPSIALDELKKNTNFTYLGGCLVLSFKEEKEYTKVTYLNVNDNKKDVLYCRRLVLATGAIGSGRIALRSLEGTSGVTKLPLLCNEYTYIPCLQPKMIGSGIEKDKLGFAQLSVFLDKNQSNTNVSVASLYSYQSLMAFRTVRQIPLNFAAGRKVLQHILPAMVIMGVHHPDTFAKTKYISLIEDPESSTGDALLAHHTLSAQDKAEFAQREKSLMKAVSKLGLIPIKKVDPGSGASIHYAGTLPFSDENKPFTLTKRGKLRGTRSVYVVDSSGFKSLPAPGLTFSLMANAHVIAEGMLIDE